MADEFGKEIGFFVYVIIRNDTVIFGDVLNESRIIFVGLNGGFLLGIEQKIPDHLFKTVIGGRVLIASDEPGELVYCENIKMKNGSATYRCLVLSFVEYENKKEKEVVTFYVTDDANHIPVRLDLYLRIGSAKAYLVGSKGVRNPMTAKIK